MDYCYYCRLCIFSKRGKLFDSNFIYNLNRSCCLFSINLCGPTDEVSSFEWLRFSHMIWYVKSKYKSSINSEFSMYQFRFHLCKKFGHISMYFLVLQSPVMRLRAASSKIPLFFEMLISFLYFFFGIQSEMLQNMKSTSDCNVCVCQCSEQITCFYCLPQAFFNRC
mgnify:CR=1 FL=1